MQKIFIPSIKLKVSIHNFGYFKLDGGSMFGAVPKVLWHKLIPADESNRIRLSTNSLLIESEARRILVDCGVGTKWNDKMKAIYGIEKVNPINDPESITDVILTHLHFDHAGGISWKDGDSLKLTYRNAVIHLQEANYLLAQNPNIREKASYLAENVKILESAKLNLLRGESEIYPGITVHPINGHTLGQQWVKVHSADKTYAFPSDLIPTSSHIPLPYHMGYDMCTETLLKEKEQFLTSAAALSWTVIFQHDPHISSGTITSHPFALK